MFAAMWMVALPISFAAPFLGILLWVWTAMLSPNELLYGFMAGVPLNKIVAVTTLPLLILGKDKKDFYLDPLLTILLLLSVNATGSWLGAIVPSDETTDLYLKFIKVLVLAFTITAIMKTRLRIHMLVIAVVVSMGFLGVKEGVISILTTGGHLINGNGSIGDNNSVATTMLMIIPLTLYLARYSEVKVVRFGMFAVAGLSVITTIMTFSRGGFVGLIVLAIGLIFNGRSKVLGIVMVTIAGVMTYFLAPAAWFDRLSTINTLQEVGNDGSFMGRVVAWKISLLIALDHPFLGGGPHAVQRAFVWNFYKPQLPNVDFITTPPPDAIPHAAHSIYFEVLGDFGFTGLLLYCTLLVLTLWRCRRIIRMARNNPAQRWAFDLARMMQISMVAFYVTGAALSMFYFELFYVLVVIVSRVHRTLILEARNAAPELTRPAWGTPAGAIPNTSRFPQPAAGLQVRR